MLESKARLSRRDEDRTVERRRRTSGYPQTMSTSRAAACKPNSKKRGTTCMSTSTFSQDRMTRTRSGSRLTPKASTTRSM